MTSEKKQQYINAARDLWQQDDLEIDDDAELSEVGEDQHPSGAWVQAWVFVNVEEVKP